MSDIDELISMMDLEAAKIGLQEQLTHLSTYLIPQIAGTKCFLSSKYQDSLSFNQLPYKEQSQESDHLLLINPQNDTPQYRNQLKITQDKSKHKSNTKRKNSNAIKKVGRIILDNLKQYHRPNRVNTGVNSMLRMLSKNSKVGRKQVNKRDKFNTHHLKLLITPPERELARYNLRTTRKILNQHLRKNVLQSQQISDQMKIIYLNTLKCTALRCVNSRFAVRLQMAS